MRARYLILLGICLVGLILRLDFLFAGAGVVDGDEAIIGLMGKHILEGRDFPIFFYGQPYMGSIESYLAAILFSLFGISGYALLAVPTAISVALIPMVYFMARGFLKEKGALFAAAYIAVPPQPLVIWSIKARGGFIETLAIGALVFILLGRAIRSERLPNPLLLGVLLGFGWWINFQAIYFILISLLIYLVLGMTQRLPYSVGRGLFFVKHVCLGGIGFFIGSLPFWIYNLSNNFASFNTVSAGGSSDRLGHLKGFFAEALPILVGARREWSYSDVFPYSSDFGYLMVFLVILSFLVLRARHISRMFSGILDRDGAVELFAIFVLLTAAIFMVSSYGWLAQAPRYLLPLYLAFAVLFGFIVNNASRIVTLPVVATALALNTTSLYLGGRAIGGQPFVTDGERVSFSHQELNDWLNDNSIDYIRTNYWIGYRVAFETAERTKFLRFQEPGVVRIPDYETKGARVPLDEGPYVLTPKQADLVRRALTLEGYTFSEQTLSGYVVLSKLAPPNELKRASLHGATVLPSIGQSSATLLDDDDVNSRWASGAPQSAGMTLNIVLPKPNRLDGIIYDYSHWSSDYPRGLAMQFVAADGALLKEYGPRDFEALRYFADSSGQYQLRFSPIAVKEIRMTLTSGHPVFDWSIGEFDLLEDNEGS